MMPLSPLIGDLAVTGRGFRVRENDHLRVKAMKLLIECWDDNVATFASARYMKRYKLKAITCYTVEDGTQFSHVAFVQAVRQ